MRTRGASWVLSGLVLCLAAASPASSGSLSGAIGDPVGDLGGSASCETAGCGPHQDILEVRVDKRGGLYVLGMTVAQALPEAPSLEPGVKQIVWAWSLDTDPAANQAGFPFPNGEAFAVGAEFVVRVVWDGASFTGQLVDRRPLLAGGGAIINPVPFKIRGSEIAAVVDESLLHEPSTFDWFGFTAIYNAVVDQGSYGYFFPDRTSSAAWPI